MSIRFELLIPSISHQPLWVTAFHSTDYQISKPYYYSIEMLWPAQLDVESCLMQHAVLSIHANENTVYRHGIIDSIRIKTDDEKQNRVCVRLRAALYYLKQQDRSQRFSFVNVPTMTERLLQQNQFHINYQMHLSKDYKKIPMHLQFQECNADYLSRLLSQWYLIFYYQHEPSKSKLIFSDDIRQSKQNHHLEFCHNSQLVNKKMVFYQLSSHFDLAGIAKVIIETNDNTTQCGEIIHCHNYPGINASQAFRVIAIAEQGGDKYRNQLTLIDAAADFHVPIEPHPSYFGPHKANIYSLTNTMADLDKNGCYHIRYPFETKREAANSKRIVLNTELTGCNTGFHFPLQHNTHVLIGYINNDTTRPIIIGTINNETYPSPVTANNSEDYIWQSNLGHLFRMQDMPERQSIELQHASNTMSCVLNNDKARDGIRLLNNNGRMSLQSGRDLTIQCDNYKEEFNKTCKNQIGKHYHMKVTHDVTFNAGRDGLLRADHDLFVKSKFGGIECHADKAIKIASAQQIKCHSDEGNMSLTGDNLTIHAERCDYQSGRSITIKHHQSKIHLDASGHIQIEAPIINLIGV